MTSPDETLFRRKAIEHYLASMERGEVVRVAPPSIGALVVVIILAALTLAIVFWAR